MMIKSQSMPILSIMAPLPVRPGGTATKKQPYHTLKRADSEFASGLPMKLSNCHHHLSEVDLKRMMCDFLVEACCRDVSRPVPEEDDDVDDEPRQRRRHRRCHHSQQPDESGNAYSSDDYWAERTEDNDNSSNNNYWVERQESIVEDSDEYWAESGGHEKGSENDEYWAM